MGGYTKGVFFRADTGKNISDRECSDIDGITESERKHTDTMIFFRTILKMELNGFQPQNLELANKT